MKPKHTNSLIDRCLRVGEHYERALCDVLPRRVRHRRHYVQVKHLKRVAAWERVLLKLKAKWRRSIGEA